MTVLIKDAEADRIVRELAARTGETITQAVKVAAEERLARLPHNPKAESGSIDRERLEAILAEFRAHRVHDPRTDDEIIGYDENGFAHVTSGDLAVDSSAIIAVLTEEPERAQFESILNARPVSYCSTVTFVETFMVLATRISGLTAARLDEALKVLAIRQLAVDPDQALLAADAFTRFGKGRHPAKLNLGDCFSYALAKSLKAPLLYKGEDFGLTDIVSAVAQGAHP